MASPHNKWNNINPLEQFDVTTYQKGWGFWQPKA